MGNPDNIYVDLKIQFNKSVLSVTALYDTGINIAESLNNNNTLYFHSGMLMSRNNTMVIHITSNEPVSFNISGVEPKQN